MTPPRSELEFAGDDAVVAKCFLLWSAVVGAISLEVFGGYGTDTLSAPRSLYAVQLDLMLDGFEVSAPRP